MTAWELGIKVSLGKMPAARPLIEHYHETLARYGFHELPFTSTPYWRVGCSGSTKIPSTVPSQPRPSVKGWCS
jgi:PIN domain nuclease of toxin-antitoxin system